MTNQRPHRNSSLIDPSLETNISTSKSGSRFRFRDIDAEEFSFSGTIEKQRKARRLTQKQAARLVPTTERTWRAWESGDTVPSRAIQRHVLNLLDMTGEPPGPRKMAALQRSHHLYFEQHKGWFLRVTINVGAKVVGKRRKFRLYTKDETEARNRRLVVIGALRGLGLTFAERIQKQTRKQGPRGQIDPL
jgi:DNA-binding transcriptional regulator YiaG